MFPVAIAAGNTIVNAGVLLIKLLSFTTSTQLFIRVYRRMLGPHVRCRSPSDEAVRPANTRPSVLSQSNFLIRFHHLITNSKQESNRSKDIAVLEFSGNCSHHIESPPTFLMCSLQLNFWWKFRPRNLADFWILTTWPSIINTGGGGVKSANITATDFSLNSLNPQVSDQLFKLLNANYMFRVIILRLDTWFPSTNNTSLSAKRAVSVVNNGGSRPYHRSMGRAVF